MVATNLRGVSIRGGVCVARHRETNFNQGFFLMSVRTGKGDRRVEWKRTAGVLLLLLGFGLLAWASVGFKSFDTVLSAKQIYNTCKIPYAPAAGVVAMLGGIGVVVSTRGH